MYGVLPAWAVRLLPYEIFQGISNKILFCKWAFINVIVAGVLVLPETISTLDLLLLGHGAYLGDKVRVQILGQLYLSAIIYNRSELEIN